MNELQITGTVKKVLQSQSGAGKKGTWTKQDILITLNGQYPKDLIITTWGDLTQVADSLIPGEVVTVHINVESREYNEKWFTEVKGWKITKAPKAEGPKQATVATVEEDLPF